MAGEPLCDQFFGNCQSSQLASGPPDALKVPAGYFIANPD